MTDRTITISEQAARTLLTMANQVQIPSAEGKVRVGTAQLELEEGLKALQVVKELEKEEVKA